MALFLFAALLGCAVVYSMLLAVFLANPLLNGMILLVLLFGVLYIFRQVWTLFPEVAWLESYRAGEARATAPTPRLLGPMATMLENRQRRMSLSTTAQRSLLDSIASRLDESRDISRYLIGLLIFLGLLGTFWGLMQTVQSVGAVVGSLSPAGSDIAGLFGELKTGLEAPLSGMGTAFSSSLFGLAGSLVLGFLDLQSSQAQNRFYNHLEEWLSGMTRLGGGGIATDGEQSVPAYLQALMETSADSLEKLQRTMARGEDDRRSANHNLVQLTDKLSTLTDQMRTEQSLLLKLTENQVELRQILQRMAEDGRASGIDESSRAHLRNMDIYLARLVEESSAGRVQAVEEVRSEIRLLARTIAALSEEG